MPLPASAATPQRIAQLRIALLAAALLAPAATGAWSQPGGDAHRSNLAGEPDGPLDVLGNATLAPDGWRMLGETLAETSAGLVGLATNGAQCSFVALDHGLKGTPFACPAGARFEGTAGELLVACVDGPESDALLQAFHADFTAAWTAGPDAAVPGLPPVPPVVPVPQPSTSTWSCRGTALDATRVVAAFADAQGRNRIVALDATGKQAWATSVPATAFQDAANASLVPEEVARQEPAFVPMAVTRTQSGLVVTGAVASSGVDANPGAVWLDTAGRIQGAYQASAGGAAAPLAAPGSGTIVPASQQATSRGNLAAFVQGDELVVVDPTGQRSSTPIGTPSLAQRVLAAPAWSRTHLLLPTEGGAILVNPQDPSEQEHWPGFAQARVQATLLAERHALVLVADGPRSDLVVVDLLQARSTQRVPLPLAPQGTLTAHLMPVSAPAAHAGASLLAWDEAGHAAWLGRGNASQAPNLDAGDLYPAAGAAATLDVELPDDAPANTTMLVAWGDGWLEEAAPGQVSHTYTEAGARTVAATAVRPDGTTATSTLVLHVGSAPPPRKGLLDVLFAPENQNYTFFGIGLTITLVGAVLGALGVHRGRHRLDRHMRTLDAIRDDGRRDPFAAIRDLHGFREARRSDLQHGHLENAQFTVLDAAAHDTLQVLRQRILGNLRGRTSDRFNHDLDVAIQDGRIDESEGAALAASVEGESRLTAAERDRLKALVASWQRVIGT